MIKFEIKKPDLKKVSKEIQKAISQLGNSEVQVGIFGEQGSELVIIAATHEFGTEHAGKNRDITIPERSYLRSAIDNNRDKITEFISKGMDKVLEGKLDHETFLNQVGVFVQGLIQERILSNIPPPNAPSTIKRKGSDRTLIDTGRLLQSITFKVKMKHA